MTLKYKILQQNLVQTSIAEYNSMSCQVENFQYFLTVHGRQYTVQT